MIYWIRIVLGAFVVFGVGLGVTSLMRRGGEQIEVLAQIPRVMATIPDRFGPLTVDGVEAGRITRVQIDPENDMRVTLDAADSAAIERIAACGVLSGPIDDFFELGLACSDPATLEGHDRFGVLQIAGTDRTVDLYAPDDQVSEFHADGHDAIVDIKADSAGETLVRIADPAGNERVHIEADAGGGARIQIRGDGGKPIFQFHVDSTGMRMAGTDSQ